MPAAARRHPGDQWLRPEADVGGHAGAGTCSSACSPAARSC